MPVLGEDTDLNRAFGKTRIATDLLRRMLEEPHQAVEVMIELNTRYPGGVGEAKRSLMADYAEPRAETSLFDPWDDIDEFKSDFAPSYIFGRLDQATIRRLAAPGEGPSPVHKIWLDTPCVGFIDASYRTVKCDAAQAAFGSLGEGVVWAVADTGVDGQHPHFAAHDTLGLKTGLEHVDFTAPGTLEERRDAALRDDDGHGTHVAGIIAGETRSGSRRRQEITAVRTVLDEDGQESEVVEHPAEIAGLAPRAKLLSLKVLTDRRTGSVSNAIAAIGHIQKLNAFGHHIRVHGLNLSLGYPFDPSIYGVGQTPLCREVNLLVRSGVVVVIAAGNGGYGTVAVSSGETHAAAFGSSIADPGNAADAITVGSTHRDRPHEFGVSYFSAKGPTADGRDKPDLIAPGERILSCQANGVGDAAYREMTGTSMAAPHVSAAIAAFLSSRGEFIGRPDRIKELFMQTATSLGRHRHFQGAGLIDLMRALQAV